MTPHNRPWFLRATYAGKTSFAFGTVFAPSYEEANTAAVALWNKTFPFVLPKNITMIPGSVIVVPDEGQT